MSSPWPNPVNRNSENGHLFLDPISSLLTSPSGLIRLLNIRTQSVKLFHARTQALFGNPLQPRCNASLDFNRLSLTALTMLARWPQVTTTRRRPSPHHKSASP